MTLENLGSERLAGLGRHAALLSVGRLDQLAESVDPSDHSLVEFLAELLAEELGVLEALPVPAEKNADRAARVDEERFVRERIPSAHQSLGEGFLARDHAMYFAETLREESARFYRSLAEHALDEEARRLFDLVTRGEERQLDRLRTVLLAG